MKRYARYLRYCGNQFIQNAVRLSLQLSALGFQNQNFLQAETLNNYTYINTYI